MQLTKYWSRQTLTWQCIFSYIHTWPEQLTKLIINDNEWSKIDFELLQNQLYVGLKTGYQVWSIVPYLCDKRCLNSKNYK